MLVKILQIIVFQGLFLFVYDFWFRKETFYTSNRIYLIATSLLAVILPFVTINISTQSSLPTQIIALGEVLLNPQNFVLPEVLLNTNKTVSGFPLLLWIYFIGVLIASSLFIWKLLKVIHLVHTNKQQQKRGFVLILLKDSTSVFSFLNYVFIGENIKDENFSYLLAHEKVHIQQLHSLDLLWFEILKIILWFNPFVYLYQKQITALHEFIADTESVKIFENKTYYNYLLNDLFQVENMAFVNQFYTKSLIQKRITMMTQTQSPNWKIIKYLFIMPLFAFLLLLSCENPKESKEVHTEDIVKPIKAENTYQKEDVSKDAVPFSIIEEVPIYPGCENIKDKVEQRKCLSKKIQIHVSKNFNVDLAQTLGLTPGKKKIFTIFKIAKNGEIIDVRARAPHKDLELEAVRVIQTLPKMISGKQDGKAVSVKYSLPITFIVEK